jgi:hypothetical protein
MPAIITYIAIALITGLNAATVFIASISGVYGDGTLGTMPSIMILGCAWVSIFAIVAFYYATNGHFKKGIIISGSAIPYGALLIVAAGIIWPVITSLL